MGRAGSFQHGARHGLGVFTLSTKVAYCGVFQQGQRNGPGVICIGGGGISLPLWPVVVCICRAGQREAVSAVNFRQDCLQHALLITDAIMAQVTLIAHVRRDQHAAANVDARTLRGHANMCYALSKRKTRA